MYNTSYEIIEIYSKMIKRNKRIKGLLFDITSIYGHIEAEILNDQQPKGINVKWSRQQQSTELGDVGKGIIWKQVDKIENKWRLDFPERCEQKLKITTFKNKKGINYERTICRYSVETEIEGKFKLFGEADIDLGQHIDTNNLTTKIMIDLIPKQKLAKKAVLVLTLKFEFAHCGDLPNYATLPRTRQNPAKVLINVLKESSNDVITIGAAKQVDMTDVLNSDMIYLLINLSEENPSELITKSKKFVSRTKLDRHLLQLIYISFEQSSEELTQLVRDCDLGFPVMKASQMLKDVSSTCIPNACVVLMIITPLGEILDTFSEFNQIVEHFEAELTNLNCDNISLQSSITVRRTRSSFANRTADILMETEEKISSLLEEKDFLTSENDQLKLTINRKISELNLKMAKEKENSETEENLEYKTTILQAERDVRTTLNKRGVSGVTGKKFRTRTFSFEDDSICYYDPINNKMKGYISITSIDSLKKAPGNKQDKSGSIFYINTANRVYEVQAQNQVHMERWISAVEILRKVVIDRISRTDTL